MPDARVCSACGYSAFLVGTIQDGSGNLWEVSQLTCVRCGKKYAFYPESPEQEEFFVPWEEFEK